MSHTYDLQPGARVLTLDDVPQQLTLGHVVRPAVLDTRGRVPVNAEVREVAAMPELQKPRGSRTRDRMVVRFTDGTWTTAEPNAAWLGEWRLKA